ncbi:MAG: hemolysin III [Planctomycetota bacterium]|uniref:PAQR family membrane homeostasis protein TrhA n=1 Tax=Patiriisocius sp. Uisw_047 TaxID=3230969 RepID=UPI0039E99426
MRVQTKNEELWNVITHGAGFLASIVGSIVLLLKYSESSTTTVIAICVFGASLITLYLVSSLYHAAKDSRLKFKLRVLDHISIYFLIAGTYTPVLLMGLSHSLGWYLFFAVWGIASIGLVLKIFFTGRFEVLSLILYVVMGWLIIFDFSELRMAMPQEGIDLLMAGGAFYTGGIVFYVWNKLKYNHVIWHLFVMAGSASHYWMILKFL